MKLNLIIILIIFLAISACSWDGTDADEESVMDLNIPHGFNFATNKTVDLEIDLQSNTGNPIPGIVYHVYYRNSRGQLRRISKQVTDETGMIDTKIVVPFYVQSLFISGFMNAQEIEIVDGEVLYAFGAVTGQRDNSEYTLPTPTREWSYLEGIQYNNQGVPSPVDIIPVTAEVLTRLDTSLPEGDPLYETHPQYLADGITTNLVIEDSSNVWLTFITEGAGYKNAVGYYTYNIEDGPPDDPSSLEHVLVFPNTSLQYSGGGLQTGMRLHLGQFGAGTVMGWFLVANGWENGLYVDENDLRLYSDRQYNPESSEYNQHSVLLYDDDSEIFLMAFEDIVRPGGDNDFNDAVFFATADPIENINRDNIPPIDIPEDTDGDGVNDPFDEYPEDPARAFKVYYPSAEDHATLVFEDKWPQYGDYDMNDLVLDYQYVLVTNAENEVKDFQADFSLKAAGAGYNNGFSILLPFEYANLIMNGSSENIFPGLVDNNDYAILDLFHNTSALTGLSAGTHFNTDPELPYYEPVSFNCDMTLTDPVDINDLAFSFPFNPFLRRNGETGHEVHLVNYPSTNRMNNELFMTEDDNSDIENEEYYFSLLNLPWGLNMPESWKYPAEKNSIVETYINFSDWAESGGVNHSDWFADTVDNINPEMIYNTP
jgi:LruC domain-containing protein